MPVEVDGIEIKSKIFVGSRATVYPNPPSVTWEGSFRRHQFEKEGYSSRVYLNDQGSLVDENSAIHIVEYIP